MGESVPSGVRSSWLRASFVGASLVWAAMLPLVPFLASRAHASAFATALVVVVYSIGALICHQLPERSYHLWTAQMPVCARCAGIYFGAALAAVVSAYAAPLKPCLSRHPFRDAGIARTALVAAVVPSAITLLAEWMSGQTPSNLIRAAAGVPIGAAVAWLVVLSCFRGPGRPPAPERPWRIR
jgi:uncharacterized membrane protein